MQSWSMLALVLMMALAPIRHRGWITTPAITTEPGPTTADSATIADE